MNVATLRLPATVDQLAHAQSFLQACTDRLGLDARRTDRLAVALEEVFVNVCHYAYPDKPGMVELSCQAEKERFVVEIADEGVAFDPLALPDPELSADLDQRRIGGLGWFLVRRMTDELDCRRENGRNIVRLALRLADPSPGAAVER